MRVEFRWSWQRNPSWPPGDDDTSLPSIIHCAALPERRTEKLRSVGWTYNFQKNWKLHVTGHGHLQRKHSHYSSLLIGEVNTHPGSYLSPQPLFLLCLCTLSVKFRPSVFRRERVRGDEGEHTSLYRRKKTQPKTALCRQLVR